MSKQTHSQKGAGRQTAKRSARSKVSRAVSEDKRHAMIAEAAYLLAEQRDFQGDAALNDWLRAEEEVNALLSAEE